LFPSRKRWVKLGERTRNRWNEKQPISSCDRNIYSLLKTIKRYRKKSPHETWLKELDAFILDVKISATSEKYKIAAPVVYPKLRDKLNFKDKNKCRPISLFSLKDRIILSITNKFLTELFDVYFEDCSYAFRSKKNKAGVSRLTHHDCIKEIIEFRRINEGNELWVVECDMDKFYDSVNHKVIIEQFFRFIEKARQSYPELNLVKPTHVFMEFLRSYSFNKNVLPLNDNFDYWEQYKIPTGEFAWVSDQFKKQGYYFDIDSERIGIPQGGALSGLIANIVLDAADKEVLKTQAFYIRFCDDMMVIHSNKEECERAKQIYVESLEKLRLVPHSFCENSKLFVPRLQAKKNLPINTVQPFWSEKSKGPYKWGPLQEDCFPWIGFVGYELHFQGHIRVRKRSLKKELTKQREIIDQIRKAIADKRRKSIGSIAESAIHRLVGMSVGRVTLRNYDSISNDLCWKNGFRELFLNPHSTKQMKQLDRYRNKLFYDLERDLKGLKEEEKIKEEVPSKRRQIIHFDKPFSYFYQVLERNSKNKH
jgi:retron-type reverse transcriptase